MKLLRTLLLLIGFLLVALGVVFLAYSRLSILHYDVDANSVASCIDDFINNWPTGGEPWFVSVPAGTYCRVCWLLALAAFALWRETGKTYTGRICRGTE